MHCRAPFVEDAVQIYPVKARGVEIDIHNLRCQADSTQLTAAWYYHWLTLRKGSEAGG